MPWRMPPKTSTVSLVLTRDTARGKGEPFKAIAALELFASLLSLMIFSHEWKKQLRGSVVISGFTDNAGNEAEGFHWRSSRQSWPSSSSTVNSTFSLSWVPREQN